MPSIALPDPPLRDGEVALRAWRGTDVAAITEACRDPEIPRWTSIPEKYTEDDAREFLAGHDADLESGRQLALAMVDASDVVLGGVGLSNFDWSDLKGEIGYWVGPEARGRGTGTRAVRLLSTWALSELGLERLELLAHPGNAASQALAQSAGFTREGLLRRYRRRHGVREDLVMFSRLAEDLEA
jgi:RimJ/RimL family protein N-acetyltransferase